MGKKIKELTHQDKMSIYNEYNSRCFTQKVLCERHNVSSYTLKLVVQEVYELIRYELYGETPKRPKKCNLCGGKVILNRCNKAQSKSGWVYYCTQCHAWVGTSPKEYDKALGELANKDTRRKRRELHTWFDKLWKNHDEREMYYDKLAVALKKGECHFSQMSDAELDKALEIVKKWWWEKFDK